MPVTRIHHRRKIAPGPLVHTQDQRLLMLAMSTLFAAHSAGRANSLERTYRDVYLWARSPRQFKLHDPGDLDGLIFDLTEHLNALTFPYCRFGPLNTDPQQYGVWPDLDWLYQERLVTDDFGREHGFVRWHQFSARTVWPTASTDTYILEHDSNYEVFTLYVRVNGTVVWTVPRTWTNYEYLTFPSFPGGPIQLRPHETALGGL